MDLICFFDRPAQTGIDRTACLRILDLPNHADEHAIKSAYRNLAREYHPDRLNNVPAPVRKLAEAKLQEINQAYEALTKHPNRDGDLSHFAIQITTTATQGAEHSRGGDITHCFVCGQKNRLPNPAAMINARCGLCYALLLLPKPFVAN